MAAARLVMSLRGKFQFLLAVFGVSIVANVLVSVWCIRIYMDEATSRFNAHMTGVQEANLAISLLEDLERELQGRFERTRPLDDLRYQMLTRAIRERVRGLPAGAQEETPAGSLTAMCDRLASECGRYVKLLKLGRRDEAQVVLEGPIGREIIAPLREALMQSASQSSAVLMVTSADLHDKQMLVTALLSVNAVVAFLLAACGVHWVRNWVLRPVAVLKTAAERHASGDLQYRIVVHADDELGTLSREVNRMADSLSAIQHRLVEQERLAAVGEVASTVAHNIRNPLAGIRASAQASLNELPEESEVRAGLVRILETVDSLNRWLRQLLMVNRPIALERAPVALRGLIDRVVEVTRAAAEGRGVRFVIEEAPADCRAWVDSGRIEQALLAIVDNAVEASPARGEVHIGLAAEPEARTVRVSVADQGAGLAPEVLDRIGSLYFTTKPGGTGIGLYMARRLIQAHDGTLEFEARPGGGTVVTIHLPGAPEVVDDGSGPVGSAVEGDGVVDGAA